MEIRNRNRKRNALLEIEIEREMHSWAGFLKPAQLLYYQELDTKLELHNFKDY